VIVTLTANAAIDRTALVQRLEPGARVRLEAEHAQAGGKGVNVARVLQRLGVAVRALVVVGGRSGAWIVEDLERDGIPVLAVEARGESRTCLEIVETATHRVTQAHGTGVEGDDALVERVERALESALAGADWLACCGSLPHGMPTEAAARWRALAARRGVRCAIDTSGKPLRAAWASGPDLLRMNREEAAAALGVPAAALPPPPYAYAGRPGLGVVSDGARTCLAWTDAGARFQIGPPRVHARSPIGCGDAMLAGLLAGLLAGRPLEQVLRDACALGAADAESWIAGRPDPARARELAPVTQVRRLDRAGGA
jgi:1-phosphofructokinase family hexose kinase